MKLNNFKEKVTDQKDFVKRQTFKIKNKTAKNDFAICLLTVSVFLFLY